MDACPDGFSIGMVNPAKAGSPSLNLNKNKHFSKLSWISVSGFWQFLPN